MTFLDPAVKGLDLEKSFWIIRISKNVPVAKTIPLVCRN